MTTLVSNAGPLIALARVDHLQLLLELFGEILVPPAVLAEVDEPGRPGASQFDELPWIRVTAVTEPTAVEKLRYWLDPGESEAIVLARSLGSPLAIDERRGRRIAASFGIEITGTVGILLAAKQAGLLSRVAPVLDALTQSGVYLSRRLRQQVLETAGEL